MKKINRFFLLSLLGTLALSGCGVNSNQKNSGSDIVPSSNDTGSSDTGTSDVDPGTSDTGTSTDTGASDSGTTDTNPGTDTDTTTETSKDPEPGDYGHVIKGYVHDPKSLIDIVYLCENEDDEVAEAIYPNQEGTSTYYTLFYGWYCIVNLKNNGYYTATGLNIDGVNYPASDYCVTFKVQVEDLSDYFLSITPTYEDTTPVLGEYTFDVSETSHLSATLYAADKVTRITSADRDDVVYVKVESDSEDYSVKEVQVTSLKVDIGSQEKTTVKYDSASDMYYFTTPYAYNKVVHVNLLELNNTLLKGTNIAGTYLTLSISSASTVFTQFDDRYLKINNGGEMELGSKNSNGTSRKDNVIELKDGNVLYTESYNSPIYGDNFILTNEDGDFGIRSPFGGYDVLAVKKQAVDDLDGIYTVTGERMQIEGAIYVSVKVYRDGALYATAFLDYGTKKALFNPTYTMLKGDEITDTMVLYTVESGDTKLVIGSNGTGTYKSRCFMGNIYGTYTWDSFTLFVGGNFKATYGDEEFDYVADGNVLTLTKDFRTLTITVDNSNRTFVVNKDIDNKVTLPEFAGRAFRNTTCFEDDYLWYGFYVIFSSEEMTLSCAGASNYNLDMDHCNTQQYMKNENVAYTYDADTLIVSANLVVKGGSTKTVELTWTGTAFLLSSKVVGNGSFYETTGTLTEVK